MKGKSDNNPNPHYEAGKILTAIRRSERAARDASNAAWKRHQDRCDKLTAGVRPEVQRLLDVSVPVTPAEAEQAAVELEAVALSPALLQPVPPADGVLAKTRGR